MKRFYTLLAALLLLPATAFAQTEPITEACNDNPDDDISFWEGELIISSPDDLAGSYVTGVTAQDYDTPVLWDTTGLLPPGVSAEIVPARDPGAGDDEDEGCATITNVDEVQGNIALMRRGACSFSTKALNAQEAGAVGFIVYMDEREEDAGGVVTEHTIRGMLGTEGEVEDVTIPGIFISRFLGEQIISQVEDFENDVVATMKYQDCYLPPVANEENVQPGVREVSAAYPNPFARSTQFDLTLDAAQHVSVNVFNVLGQRVATLHEGALAGETTHTFTFEASDLPGGVYLYRVNGETFSQTKQVTLVR
jgi:hypothetical protein